MKCPECGRENPDDAVVCSECGWVLVWVRADGPNLRTSRLAIASAVLGILSIPCFSSQIKTDSLDFPSACLIGFASWITGVSAVSLGVAALACIELNRNYIGIELMENYYKLTLEAISAHRQLVAAVREGKSEYR